VDALRAAVLRLLEEPSFTEAAAKVRAEILAEPTPNDIVPVLERMTASARQRTEAPPSTATTVPLV
jgi:UDP:flavonoid glycosyltransferase YjiC (YdhE family)